MSAKKHITDLIDHWKPRRLLASEIDASLEQVHKWAKFNRIPSEWQASVIRAAQNNGMKHIDGDWMVAAHSKQENAA